MSVTPESTTKVYLTDGWTRIHEVYPNTVELEGENPKDLRAIEKREDLHATSFLMEQGRRPERGYILSFDRIADGKAGWESIEVSADGWTEQNYTMEWYGRIAQEAEKWLGSNDLVITVS